MKSVTVKSGLKKKINLPVQKIKEKGTEEPAIHKLTDEEMAAPGEKPSIEQLEEWLAKEDGDKYGIDEAFSMIRREYATVRKVKKQ